MRGVGRVVWVRGEAQRGGNKQGSKSHLHATLAPLTHSHFN